MRGCEAAFAGNVEPRIGDGRSFVLAHIRVSVAHNGKRGELAGTQSERFLSIGNGIAEAMLAHANLRHGGVGCVGSKIGVVEVKRLIQCLLRQLKIFHIASLSGALEKCGAQGGIGSRIFRAALRPALHGLNNALSTGSVGHKQRGRHW